jgi:hypothetical protein
MREQGANIKVICVVLKGPVRCVIMILKGSVLHKQPSLKPKGLKQTKATQIDPLRGDWKTLRAEDRNRKGPGPVDSQRDTGRQGRTSNGRFKGPQRRCWGADGGERSWLQTLESASVTHRVIIFFLPILLTFLSLYIYLSLVYHEVERNIISRHFIYLTVFVFRRDMTIHSHRHTQN